MTLTVLLLFCYTYCYIIPVNDKINTLRRCVMKDFEDNFISGSINDPDEDIYESIEKEKEEKKKQEEELRKESEKTEKKMKEDEDVMYRSENPEERFDDGMEPGNKRMAEDDINKYIIYIQAKTGQDKIEKSVREKIDTVAKAAAAYMLLKADNTKEFSESLINKNATNVKAEAPILEPPD